MIVPEPVDIVTSAIISEYVVTFQLLQILRRLATSLRVQQQATRAKVGKKVVLLQTAQVTAIGESTQVPVRTLLDSGSQLSYITTNLRERLRLKSIQREKLSVNTFGNSSFNVRTCVM